MYRLQIVQGEKVAYADRIETVHGKKAVNIEALGLDHPYLELPDKVTQQFKNALFQKAEDTVSLVPAGKSLLNGKQYYKLSADISPESFKWIKNQFEFYDCEGEFSGWLTCHPDVVSEKLGCVIAKD